jgi:hypothetical protein
MAYKKQFLICILTNRNVNYATTVFLHLHAALNFSEKHRNECKIVFACSPGRTSQLKLLQNLFKNDYDIDIFECDGYLNKLHAVFSTYSVQDYQYFIKCDDDVLMSANTWINLLENSSKELTDEMNLLTTVNLSTGIPSWSYFVTVFFSENEKRTIYNNLANDEVPDNMWGNNYSALNRHIKSQSSWNEERYWETMNSLGYYYKGLHPIRSKLNYTVLINSAIVNSYLNFQCAVVRCSFEKIKDRYLCNNVFVIRYEVYQRIIRDKSLYIDDFDEVPLNRYREKNNLNICFLKDSLGVHIAYNMVYDQTAIINNKIMNGKKVEDFFLKCYFSNIKKYLKDIGCNKIDKINFQKLTNLQKCNNMLNQLYFSNLLKRIKHSIKELIL